MDVDGAPSLQLASVQARSNVYIASMVEVAGSVYLP